MGQLIKHQKRQSVSVTMREVAERAGVSKAAVSYVLNGREVAMRIPDETRERILKAVRDLGYYPNALARSLANKGTHAIAVVMQYSNLFSGWSGFTNELMHGLTDASVVQGYNLMLQTRQPERHWQGGEMDPVDAEVATLTDGRVDGALLLRDVDDPLPIALRQRGFPAVLMFTTSCDPAQWYIDCDNLLGGRLATKYLLSLGHRRIMHVCGTPHSGAAQERCVGYCNALQDAGLTVNPDWILEATSPLADLTPAVELFHQPREHRPTAIFAWSDDVAIKLMCALRGLGLRIPDDVAIVGFDSTALCDHTDPPLTSMRQPIYDMAARALTLLTERLHGETPDKTQIRVEPSLMVRHSCGGSLERRK
jgi:DNA-binding LacI/PurR family transcriptional regulator